MDSLNLVQLCSIKCKVNLIKCKSKQKKFNTKKHICVMCIYVHIFFRATWGAVGHGALYHSQVQFLVYLSQSLLGEVLVKLPTLVFDRVLSRTLHTHRVSRLPFHGVLQRPRACFFLVSGIHCMYNDAVSSPFDDDILLKKSSIPIIPPRDQNPCIFFEPKILYRSHH